MKLTYKDAVKIVKYLWKEFTDATDVEDNKGIDGFIGNESVQVKADNPQIRTGNILWMESKLSYNVPTPVKFGADCFIFVTCNNDGGYALKASTETLKAAAKRSSAYMGRSPAPWSGSTIQSTRGRLIAITSLPEGSYEIRKFTKEEVKKWLPQNL